MCTVDLSEYASKILSEKDRPLFEEAVRAGKAGIFRAAYIMIWLACAESLKRRFREAELRDNNAGKIVGEIDEEERKQKAVDRLLLERARDYGFLSSADYERLDDIYKMRCVYVHPYERAPSREELEHAASIVVNCVLSLPVKLRHGFGEQLLENLLRKQNFLDDYQPAVEAFVREHVIPKMDESIYKWFLERYWADLEGFVDDPTMEIFSKRGIWFCGTMLTEIGVNLFSPEEWHRQVMKFPKILIRVCKTSAIFKQIAEFAQNSLVGAMLEESSKYPEVLRFLEGLNNEGALTERQQKRFAERVSQIKPSDLGSVQLRTKTLYEVLIAALRSHDWNQQNLAIHRIVLNDANQAAELSEAQQVELGRNILQAGEGGAHLAVRFLKNLAERVGSWPFSVVLGIALEMFVNEKNEIRFKDSHLKRFLDALVYLEEKQREQLITKIAECVKNGTPNPERTDKRDFDSVLKILEGYEWAAPLTSSLKTKAAGLSDISC